LISPIEAWVAERTGLNERLSAESLRAWQLARIKETIEYARGRSLFYAGRLAGVDSARIASMEDMEGVPFTWPQDLARDPEALACVPAREIGRIITLSTSGSQGPPKRVFFTERDLERTADFFAHGMSTMMRAGQRALILMSDDSRYGIGDLLRRGLARIGAEGEIHGNVRDVPRAIEAARGSDCLVGVPGEVIYMCRAEPGLRPRSVLLSADYVPESVIDAIRDAWHCDVYTHWGMTETGFGGGVQCRAGSGYHLRDADLYVEVVDWETGRRVEPGQYGEIVVTTLAREAMPLIRYRTGDTARMLAGGCPCGGILPVMDKVGGRRANLIPVDDGGPLSVHMLDEICFKYPGIRNYRAELVRMDGMQVLSLTVDADAGLRHEDFSGYLAGSLGIAAKIQIEYARVEPFAGRSKRRILLAGAPGDDRGAGW